MRISQHTNWTAEAIEDALRGLVKTDDLEGVHGACLLLAKRLSMVEEKLAVKSGCSPALSASEIELDLHRRHCRAKLDPDLSRNDR